MQKLLAILLVSVSSLAFGYMDSFAKPYHKGNWVSFATVEGRNVGQPDQLKVYYNKDTVRVSNYGQSVYVEIWIDDPTVPLIHGRSDYIFFTKLYGTWVYQAESNRVRNYTYKSGGQSSLSGWRETSSNIPAEPIPKGSILHLLLKALRKDNFGIDFDDSVRNPPPTRKYPKGSWEEQHLPKE
jgi:hypothetical protein